MSQTYSIFLEAGRDFVDEGENGTEDIWWILEGQDYPRLWWETFSELEIRLSDKQGAGYQNSRVSSKKMEGGRLKK
jgi:hypothetical protein